jgi:hypothetical protein
VTSFARRTEQVREPDPTSAAASARRSNDSTRPQALLPDAQAAPPAMGGLLESSFPPGPGAAERVRVSG